MALQVGSQGEAVARVQRALAARGFDAGSADGSYGPGTKAAVVAFQRSLGLVDDGVVGDRTWAALGLPGSPPSPPRAVRID